MDWFFLGLVILGSILGWAKDPNKVPGQYIIQEVTKERFGRALIFCSWSSLFWYWNMTGAFDQSSGAFEGAILIFALYAIIYFTFMKVNVLTKSVIANYKNQRLFSQNYDYISYKVARNMYLMHPELFKWDYDSIYPAFKGIEFRMTYFDLLRFSLLYNSPKIEKNGVVSQMMLEQLDKDMARIQKEKEKSIQEVNHASTELANIMASMKGKMK